MMLQWALGYAAIGWPVFRLSGYKTPLKGTHGHKDATCDEQVIRSWWADGADFPNIGLACGVPTEREPGGIVVFDCDGPGGIAEFEALAARTGGMPHTWVSQTSRGRHYFFKVPAACAGQLRTRNAPRTSKGDDELDLKGVGGYVMLPPSLNKAKGVRVAWITGPHELPSGPASTGERS